MSHVLAAVSGVWTIASVFVIALRGNLLQPWATLDGSAALVAFIRILLSLSVRSLTFFSMTAGLQSKSLALSLSLLYGGSPSTSFGASK